MLPLCFRRAGACCLKKHWVKNQPGVNSVWHLIFPGEKSRPLRLVVAYLCNTRLPGLTVLYAFASSHLLTSPTSLRCLSLPQKPGHSWALTCKDPLTIFSGLLRINKWNRWVVWKITYSTLTALNWKFKF